MREIESLFCGRTFDDFLLKPRYSVLVKRSCSLSMPLTKNIELKGMPIVAANMGTVVGEEMGKKILLEGGFVFLPRDCPVEKQVAMLKAIRKYHGSVVDEPLIIDSKKTIAQARALMKQCGISGLLVEEGTDSKLLCGILSRRDMPLDSENDHHLVESVMTKDNLLVARQGIKMEEAEKLMWQRRVEKLPIVEKRTGRLKIRGLITMKDLRTAKQKPNATKDKKGRLLVGAAIGATRDRWGVDYLERAEELILNGAKCILIDLAHFHSVNGKRATLEFRKRFPDIDLVGGNIATPEAALDAIEWGVDAIKVGIGPGKGCRTRIETNFGITQVEAIRGVYLAVENKVPIIADGGIERDGAIFLAIAVGAKTVMLGSMLAGTEESPGIVIEDPKMGKIKIYRGSTSPQAVISNIEDEEEIADALMTPSEGQEIKIPYKGGVDDILRRIKGHLRSAVSYSGQKDLRSAHEEIARNAEKYFSKWLSEAAKKESFIR